jgi:hypothetical protein
MARYGEADSTDCTDMLCDQIAMTPRMGFGVDCCQFRPGILIPKSCISALFEPYMCRQQILWRTPVPDDLV